tara:strand:+ start:883 stop:1062 length:180 start_codon:yes stop_codon:yes gene_type:complete
MTIKLNKELQELFTNIACAGFLMEALEEWLPADVQEAYCELSHRLDICRADVQDRFTQE